MRKLRRRLQRFLQANLDAVLSAYPPYLGAGIRVRRLKDAHGFHITMPLRLYNRNYVGTHFGGSLYSMVDPFYMLLLIEALGPDYIVWDKAAHIHFRRPGTGRVHARIALDDDTIARVRAEADSHYSTEPVFPVHILAEDGTLVAEVEKVLYVRRKDAKRPVTH